jgi:hypothetical protein
VGVLEELNRTLVLLGLLAGAKGAKILPLAGSGVQFSGI